MESKKPVVVYLEELLSLTQELELMQLANTHERYWYDHLHQLHQQQEKPSSDHQSSFSVPENHCRFSNIEDEEKPTVGIDYGRLVSFLDFDNSFLTPWNYNPNSNEKERDEEMIMKKRRSPRYMMVDFSGRNYESNFSTALKDLRGDEDVPKIFTTEELEDLKMWIRRRPRMSRKTMLRRQRLEL